MPARVADIEKAGVPCILVSWKLPGLQDIARNAFERLGIRTAFNRQLEIDSGYDTNVPASYSIPDLIKALTAPLTAAEKKSGRYKPKAPSRIAFTGTFDEVQDYFRGDLKVVPSGGPWAKWTDGLPIIPPTEERVAEMLTGTNHAPDELVCKMPPEGWEVTVENVAINGVMAGCKPEYMPVLLAMAEVGGPSAWASPCSFSAMFVVSGPIAKQIGMNSGLLIMSPNNPANATLARAVWLMGINLGGKRPGVNLLGQFGNPADYGCCLAESEDNPWTSLSEDVGFKQKESTLSKFYGLWNLDLACAGMKTSAGKHEAPASVELLSDQLKHQVNVQGAAIIMTPSAVRRYIERGFATKQKLQDWLWDNTTQTYKEWTTGYWFTYERKQFGERGKRCWSEDYLNLTDDALVPFLPSPESIHIIVAGGNQASTAVLHAHKPTTVSIDKWQ